MEVPRTYRLGDISEMKYGKLPPESIPGGKFPIYSGYRYVGFTDTYNCKAGDLIVVARGVGGTGDVKLLKKDCYLTNLSISVVLDRRICNPEYLCYRFQIKNLRYLDSGSAQSQITIDDLKRLEISLPSLSEQNRVVYILKSLDDKIALNNHINHNLVEQARALYKSWFVDFDPFIDCAFIDSELGKIPQGWDVLHFDEFTVLSNERVSSESIPEFSVTNTGIYPREAKFNKQLSSSSLKNKVIREGDLVFGMSREILNWGVMKEDVGGVSSAYTVYRVNPSLMDDIYLEYFINHHLYYFKDLVRPAAREGQGIDKKVFASKCIYRPTDLIWKSFLKIYTQIIGMEKQLFDETQKLIELRDGLLPTLMEGSLLSK
jgi:type I restriction enzyme S subunit